MLKRLTVAVAALFVLASSAFGAGTVPGFSLTPQFDLTGHVAPGCKLYIIQAGTTSTPQIAYQDTGLTIPATGGSTLTCDTAGRLPQWFVADGNIKIRLTTSTGTQIFAQDGLLVVGASSGGGGGSPVDPTTVIATGDVKYRYGTGVLTGFVRANGRTIGSATSGATERANSDAQTLFEYLWTTDANLTVSTGRGASANADWVANKTIALPDFRGRIAIAADDMGNTAAGRVTTALSAIDGITLGASGGTQTKVVLTTNLPPLAHTHGLSALPARAVNQITQSSGTGGVDVVRVLASTTNATDSTDPGGSSTPMTIMPPGIIITTYLKL